MLLDINNLVFHYLHHNHLNSSSVELLERTRGLRINIQPSTYHYFIKHLDNPCTFMHVFKNHDCDKKLKDYALIRASKLSYYSAVKYLIKIGAELNPTTNGPLLYASEYGHLKVVKLLIQSGADVQIMHNCAIKGAIDNNHLEVAKYLVSRGANIHYSYSLKSCAIYDHLEMFKYLVSLGVDPHIDDDNIFASCLWHDGVPAFNVAEYLRNLGARIHNRHIQVLWYNVDMNRLHVVKYLVESGANIYVDNEYALRLSLEKGYDEITNYLLSIRTNTNVNQTQTDP